MDHETAEDIKRHFNVVAEGLRSEIRLVADGVASINERLDATNDRLDATNDRLDATNERLDTTNERLDGATARLDARLDATNDRVDGILSRIAEEFRDMRAMIRLMFGDLDRRIRALEAGRA